MYNYELFNTKLDGFCEATIYGNQPEYMNSITSLIMTIVGFFGIFNNKHNCQNIYMLFSALFLNGFSSFMYHWTAYYGWGLFDAMTMNLIVIYGVSSSLDEIKHLYNFNHRNILFNLIPVAYYMMMIVPPCVGGDTPFRVLFGLFLGFIVFSLLLIHNKLEHIRGLDHRLLHDAYKGIIYIALAGGFWITTEVYCDSFWFVKYLQGHTLWHLFVSYGGYQVGQLLTALHILRHNNGFYYDNKKMFIYKYFPSLVEVKIKT
jgi:hypothetical protein